MKTFLLAFRVFFTPKNARRTARTAVVTSGVLRHIFHAPELPPPARMLAGRPRLAWPQGTIRLEIRPAFRRTEAALLSAVMLPTRRRVWLPPLPPFASALLEMPDLARAVHQELPKNKEKNERTKKAHTRRLHAKSRDNFHRGTGPARRRSASSSAAPCLKRALWHFLLTSRTLFFARREPSSVPVSFASSETPPPPPCCGGPNTWREGAREEREFDTPAPGPPSPGSRVAVSVADGGEGWAVL